MKKIGVIISIFVIIVILHFIANATGLYEGRIVWFDNVLHFLTGFAFGLVWLWLVGGKVRGAILFVFFLAILWELAEFGFLKLFPTQAYALSIFSPSINEALVDILSNILGVVGLIFVHKKQETLEGQKHYVTKT